MRRQNGAWLPVARRTITADEKPLPEADGQNKGPNMEQLGHVSEEAADMAETTGETAPQTEEHGTPVQEVGRDNFYAYDFEAYREGY